MRNTEIAQFPLWNPQKLVIVTPVYLEVRVYNGTKIQDKSNDQSLFKKQLGKTM